MVARVKSSLGFHEEKDSMANVSGLLYRRGETPSFLDNLQITEACHLELRAARTKVRQCLRAEFVKASKADIGFTVRPRFFTQGSFAYRTINDPAWTPPQQMDLDDGTYLPMTFVQGAKPSVAAAAFFTIVDRALRPAEEGTYALEDLLVRATQREQQSARRRRPYTSRNC